MMAQTFQSMSSAGPEPACSAGAGRVAGACTWTCRREAGCVRLSCYYCSRLGVSWEQQSRQARASTLPTGGVVRVRVSQEHSKVGGCGALTEDFAGEW